MNTEQKVDKEHIRLAGEVEKGNRIIQNLKKRVHDLVGENAHLQAELDMTLEALQTTLQKMQAGEEAPDWDDEDIEADALEDNGE